MKDPCNQDKHLWKECWLLDLEFEVDFRNIEHAYKHGIVPIMRFDFQTSHPDMWWQKDFGMN